MALLVATAATLAGPGLGGCSEGRCLPPPPGWPDRLEFGFRIPDAGVEYERFSVDPAGRILWTGFPGRPTPVSLADFREILPVLGDGPGEPWLILDAPPGADCATVRQIRAELDRLPLCRRGRCVDGEVWDRSDPPKGGF